MCVTPWTIALQAPLSMKFSRQEYWSRLLFPTPRDLPDPGIEPTSPAMAGRFFTTEPPRKPIIEIRYSINIMYLNHHETVPLAHPRSVEKLSSTNPGSGTKMGTVAIYPLKSN